MNVTRGADERRLRGDGGGRGAARRAATTGRVERPYAAKSKLTSTPLAPPRPEWRVVRAPNVFRASSAVIAAGSVARAVAARLML